MSAFASAIAIARAKWCVAALRILATWSAVLLGACQSTSDEVEPKWIEDDVTSASERVLWEVTAMALSKQGFPVGTGLDPRSLVATSGWRVSLHPFRNQGFREQAEVHFTRKGPERYGVRVRVSRQKNSDIVRPLDASYAHWEHAPDGEEEAQILLHLIRAFVGADELSIGDPKARGHGS